MSDDCVQSGGASAVALSSIRLLRQRGVEVTMLSGDVEGNDELERLGVDLRTMGESHILSGFRGEAAIRGLYNSRTRSFVDEWISSNDTPGTVYHLHNWHKVLSPSVFLPLRRVADRLVISAHDYFLSCPNGGFFHYPKGQSCELRPLSAACLTTSCDRRHYAHKVWRVARQGVVRVALAPQHSPAIVLAVHEGMIPLLARGGIPTSSIRVVRNPVVPWCDARIEAERNRDLLFVGRIEPDKGVDLFLEAARRANASAVVVGEGPSRPALAERYPEARFLGHRSKAELGAIAAAARAIVVPTRWRETFGLVTLEAMMSGLPAIVSSHALISEEVARTGGGEACDPYDEDALADAIRRVSRDDALVGRMSRAAFVNGRALAPRPDRWCDELLSLYAARVTARAA